MTTEDLTAELRARRAALAAEHQQGAAQYEHLEQQLALLRRNLDVLHGAIQEVDRTLALLAEEAPVPAPIPA